MLQPYLVCRNKHYYFRIWIPDDLRPFFNRSEIKKSLKTTNCIRAKNLVKAMLYHTERIFTLIRSGMLTNEQIKQLAADFITTTLNRCEEIRSIGVVVYEPKEEVAPSSTLSVEPPVDDMTRSVKACEALMDQFRKQLFTNDFSEIEVRVSRHLQQNNISVDKSSQEYTKLCREILKAEIEIMNVEIERLKGNYDNKYDKFYQQTFQKLPVTEKPIEGATPTYLLSQMIKEYINEITLSGTWTEKTCYENTNIFALFVKIMGDRDIRTITHKNMLEFRDTFSKLPANMNKKEEYQKKSIEQILRMEIDNKISITTINKYVQRISALFNWAVKHEYIQHNCAEGLAFKIRKPAEQDRSVFSKDDIVKIFSALPRDKNRPERFWIPMIALYSGMRLDEICQLHLDDIVEIDGVLCFDVNDKGDKKLKNQSSKRIVPIHPELLRQGFRLYLLLLRGQDQSRLWPNLKKRRDGYAQDFGKWYQQFNRKNITEDPKKVFHSYRHTLTDNMKQKGIEESVIAEILGHASSSITMSRYGKRYEPKKLLKALEKLDYGVKIPLPK